MRAECVVNSLADCTAFQRDLLWALSHENTRKKLSLKTELDDYYDESISHSRLNQSLNELVDLGLVTKQAHSKRTNEYRLTESARRTLSARQAWQAGHRDDTTAGGHN